MPRVRQALPRAVAAVRLLLGGMPRRGGPREEEEEEGRARMSAKIEERRRVAARLRAIEVPDRIWKLEHPKLPAAWYELICAAVGGEKDPWFGVKALGDRLADLIDPCDDPSSQCYETLGRCDEIAAADTTKPAGDTTKCDRAARRRWRG